MPANTKYFFRFIITIATFDLIPTEGILSWAGSHIRASKVLNEMPENFVDFEFEDSDPVQNMRAFFLFLGALLCLPIMLQVVQWIVSRSD